MSMRPKTFKAGPLTVHVVDLTDEPPEGLVVLAHGFGAPGTDLVPLAAEIASLSSGLPKLRFVFPEAPLDLADIGYWGARAWFPIDMEELLSEGRTGRTERLAATEPPGLADARKALAKTVDALLIDAKLPWSRLVLGGFSQGAMVALDLALRSEEAPAAVVAYSPTLVDRATWERRAALRQGLPVLISHGRQDAILPFAATEGLVSLLTEQGLEVEFRPFDGPHTISADALERTVELLIRFRPG